MSEIRTGCNDSCPYYYKNTGCLKPEGLFCPPQSITYEIPYDKDAETYQTMHKDANIPTYARRCIICGEVILYNNMYDGIVCEDCKEAIAWVKKNIKN